MRDKTFHILALCLTVTALTGCDLINQILEGNVTLNFGNIVLAGPGAQKAPTQRPIALLSTMGQSVPKPAETAQAAKSSWGTCDESTAEVVTRAFQRAQAEVTEILVTSVEAARDPQTVKFAKRSVNLLRLASEISSILVSASIPVGEYKEVVVHLEKATLTTKNGQQLPLEFSQDGKRVIHIVLERSIVIEQPSDAERISLSFCTEGNFLLGSKDSPKAAFHPIIDRVTNLSL